MLNNVVIDVTTRLRPSQSRLASIFYLVADEVTPAHLYLFKDWALRTIQRLPTDEFQTSTPRVVYLSDADLAASESLEGVPLHVPRNELVLSESSAVHKGVLEQQGLNATTAILILAAAGIDLILPNVSFDQAAREEIEAIKRSLEDERQQYLAAVAVMADQAFDRLSSGSYADTLAWAQNEAQLKIIPKARLLQTRLRRLDRSVLHRAGTQFWNEGVPAIGSALAERGLRAGATATAIELVRILSEGLARSIEERRVPEVSYILKLARELPE